MLSFLLNYRKCNRNRKKLRYTNNSFTKLNTELEINDGDFRFVYNRNHNMSFRQFVTI